jgi:hypothetical protein
MLDALDRLGCGVLISPGAGDLLIAIDGSGIAIADDGVRIQASNQADVLMDNGGSPAGTTTVRLWQNDLVAIQVERSINWTQRGDSVAWMESAGSPS